jgi:CHAT domain-containing protein
MSERSRSRAFLDSIANHENYQVDSSTKTLIDAIKQSRTKTEQLERQLTQVDSTKSKEVEAMLNTERKNQVSTIERLQKTDPKAAQMVVVESISRQELIKYLNKDTAIIEYMLAGDQLFIWLISTRGIEGRIVRANNKQITTLVDEFRTLLQNYSTMEYVGRELSQLLISPIYDQAKNYKRLAIIPHSSLHFLSFAALPVEDSFLLDHHSIFYMESATMFRYLRPRTKQAVEKTVLALGNPSLGKDNDLPFAEKEAKSISRNYRNLSLALNKLATESTFKSHAPNHDIIHIASHGVFNELSPIESKLMLVADKGEDGDLTVQDVLNLKLNADLVTLSACETGLGKISSGDEVVGLNRAFFYAGTSTLVSSLWRISDVASAVTIKRFYRNLAQGEDKADAMRHAQLLVRNYYKHPAYWSAFRLIGRTD